MRRGLVADDLERRPHLRLEKVPTHRRAAPLPEHGMQVQLRTARLVFRDVAGEREHLRLLLHWDALVLLALPIPEGEGGALERADGSHLRRRQLLVAREPGQAIRDLVASVESSTAT